MSDRNQLPPSYFMHTISQPQINIVVSRYTHLCIRVRSQVSPLCLSKMIRNGIPGMIRVSTWKTDVRIIKQVSQLRSDETVGNGPAISSNTG